MGYSPRFLSGMGGLSCVEFGLAFFFIFFLSLAITLFRDTHGLVVGAHFQRGKVTQARKGGGGV